MSAIHPKADIPQRRLDVRLGLGLSESIDLLLQRIKTLRPFCDVRFGSKADMTT
jgi:hypothetical protein